MDICGYRRFTGLSGLVEASYRYGRKAPEYRPQAAPDGERRLENSEPLNQNRADAIHIRPPPAESPGKETLALPHVTRRHHERRRPHVGVGTQAGLEGQVVAETILRAAGAVRIPPLANTQPPLRSDPRPPTLHSRPNGVPTSNPTANPTANCLRRKPPSPSKYASSFNFN